MVCSLALDSGLLAACVGTHFVNRISRITKHPSSEDLNAYTKAAIKREQQRKTDSATHEGHAAEIAHRWKTAAKLAVKQRRKHVQDHIKISLTEHMSGVDVYDGAKSRLGKKADEDIEIPEEDLLVVHLSVDGRLRDVARSEK